MCLVKPTKPNSLAHLAASLPDDIEIDVENDSEEDYETTMPTEWSSTAQHERPEKQHKRQKMEQSSSMTSILSPKNCNLSRNKLVLPTPETTGSKQKRYRWT